MGEAGGDMESDRRSWARTLRDLDRATRATPARNDQRDAWRVEGRAVTLQVGIEVDCEVGRLFDALTDLEQAARLFVPVRTRLLVPGTDGTRFGEGSVREFSPFPGLRYEERILSVVANERLVWTFVRGGPVRDHLGTMEFEALGPRRSRMTEQVRFTCTLPGIARVLGPVVYRANLYGFRQAKAVLETMPEFPDGVPSLLEDRTRRFAR